MNFEDLFIQIVKKAATLQRKSGEMPSGFNGPHGHTETPIRTTSHWLISFVKAYELTKMQAFHDAAVKCKDYLLKTPHLYRSGATFIYRTSPNADRCNGLIGTAWTLEALIHCYRYFKDEKCLELAEKLFLLHPFSLKTYRWSRVECDGKVLTEDLTFNHQLWFCAASLPLVKLSKKYQIQTPEVFLNKLEKNIAIRNTGCIVHAAQEYPKNILRNFKYIINKNYREIIEEKEWGYHCFNIMALCMIKKEWVECKSLKSTKVLRAIELLSDIALRAKLATNKYAYPYNPPGFEVPCGLYVFSCKNWLTQAEYWLNQQFKNNYCPLNRDLSRNVPDPITLTARIYEVHLLPVEFFKMEVNLEK